jgi:hypothetical protein
MKSHVTLKLMDEKWCNPLLNGWKFILEIGFRVHAANGKAQHSLMMGQVFFLGVRWWGVFFFLVPNVFSTCSHHVPMRFFEFSSCSPKTFPAAPQFYPIWFAQSSTLTYTNWKRVGCKGGAHLFLFCNWGPKRCFILRGVPQSSKKKRWWANPRGSFTKENKKIKRCEWPTMNHTMTTTYLGTKDFFWCSRVWT